jgi:hypothetical protein
VGHVANGHCTYQASLKYIPANEEASFSPTTGDNAREINNYLLLNGGRW